jgi:aspartyl-tRNA(Asn)/glutamyl-tRNA(Gln) amidotransferase subunit C
MSEITKKEIAHLAHLARLQLTEEEIAGLHHHFQVILDYVQSLDAMPDLELSPEPRKTRVEFRKDVAGESLFAEEALANGPEVRDNQFVVPLIKEDLE